MEMRKSAFLLLIIIAVTIAMFFRLNRPEWYDLFIAWSILVSGFTITSTIEDKPK